MDPATLATHSLPTPPPPAQAAVAAAPGFTETPVTIPGPEGLPLAGILCEPTAQPPPPAPPAAAAAAQPTNHQHPSITSSTANPSNPSSSNPSSSEARPFKPQQCAILCHGFASHKDGFHFPTIAHHLAQQLGMSSLRFDYTGNKDSPGPFRFASFMQEVSQMAVVKRHLKQQHGKQVVLLLGGAINATLYSGQASVPLILEQQQQQQQPDRDGAIAPVPASSINSGANSINSSSSSSSRCSHIIPLVVLVAGRYDLTLNMHQRYGGDVVQQLQQSGPVAQATRRDGDRHEIHWELDAQSMAERFSLDVSGACDLISSMQPDTRPHVLVLHGGSDPICEGSDAANLCRHIAGSQLVVVEGADHWFKGRQQQLLDAVTGFVLQAGRAKGLCCC